jgi:phytoene dehydrogenase-like protein
MLVRVTTFANDPEHQSAGAALDQLQLAVAAGVLYVDGGWQTIVDGLRSVALAGGVRIISGAHAVALETAGARDVDAVRLADGTTVRASGVIIAAGPAEVDAVAGTRFATETPPPSGSPRWTSRCNRCRSPAPPSRSGSIRPCISRYTQRSQSWRRTAVR